MSRMVSIIICLLLYSSLYAQNARLYESLPDFLTSRFSTATITVEKHTKKNKVWQEAETYFVNTGNRKLTKRIEEEYFAVEHHDSLFLNCGRILGVYCYANVLLRCGNCLFFSSVAPYNSNDKAGAAAVTAFAGLALAATTGTGFYTLPAGKNGEKKSRYSYWYNMETGLAEFMTPELMATILQQKPNLYNSYLKGGMTDNEQVYYYYLSRYFYPDSYQQ